MSIDNNFNSAPSAKTLHADYKFDSSAFQNPNQHDYAVNNSPYLRGVETTVSFSQQYFIPLDSVIGQVFNAEEIILNAKSGIEQSFLSKLYINPYVDMDLNEAHYRVWTEFSRQNPSLVEGVSAPSFICFEEYKFAEKFASTASRRFITEFERSVADTSFSYFFQIRKLLSYFASEIALIKSSLLINFGADYENESQQKIALRFDTWAKMAIHYTRRIASTILAQPGKIPYAEVDKITKKQAAQFQAFFAIRLNAVDSEINDILNNLKRDLVDNGEIFYTRYLNNSLKFTKDIVNSLDLEYHTTSMRSEMPTLAGEVLLATNLLQGNFSSIHADLIERFEMFIQRVDAVLMLIHEKRRFSSYISQLAEKAIQKRKVLQTVTEDDYSKIFKSLTISASRNDGYASSHGLLDDLGEDSHPQYLMKDGGVIVGDISVENNAKIDGVSISGHSHSGSDGSSKILSSSIDYETPRRNYNNSGLNASSPLSISIDRFIPDILDGGVPVFDTIVLIEFPDDAMENHELEIIYTEIE